MATRCARGCRTARRARSPTASGPDHVYYVLDPGGMPRCVRGSGVRARARRRFEARDAGDLAGGVRPRLLPRPRPRLVLAPPPRLPLPRPRPPARPPRALAVPLPRGGFVPLATCRIKSERCPAALTWAQLGSSALAGAWPMELCHAKHSLSAKHKHRLHSMHRYFDCVSQKAFCTHRSRGTPLCRCHQPHQ